MEYPNAQKIVDAAYEKFERNQKYADWFCLLTELEQVCESVGRLNYQVCNGGFSQWYYNGYSSTSSVCCESLIKLKCVDAANLVQDYMKRVSYGNDSSNVYDDDLEVNDLDTQFYVLMDDMMEKLEAYATKQLTNQEASDKIGE